jgi:hypothetical protein
MKILLSLPLVCPFRHELNLPPPRKRDLRPAVDPEKLYCFRAKKKENQYKFLEKVDNTQHSVAPAKETVLQFVISRLKRREIHPTNDRRPERPSRHTASSLVS